MRWACWDWCRVQEVQREGDPPLLIRNLAHMVILGMEDELLDDDELPEDEPPEEDEPDDDRDEPEDRLPLDPLLLDPEEE